MEKNLEYVKEIHFEEMTEKLVHLGWENIVQIQRDDNQELFDFQTLEEQIQIINKIDDKLIKSEKINDLKTKDRINIFEYLFSHEKFYQFITTYSFFANEVNNLVKYMAAPHQFKAVKTLYFISSSLLNEI